MSDPARDSIHDLEYRLATARDRADQEHQESRRQAAEWQRMYAERDRILAEALPVYDDVERIVREFFRSLDGLAARLDAVRAKADAAAHQAEAGIPPGQIRTVAADVRNRLLSHPAQAQFGDLLRTVRGDR